jgi:putative transposase
MSEHVYSEINLHITWHTKISLPMINADLEGPLHQYLKNRIVQTPGAYFHAIGGIETHIHIATSVEPSIHIDEWIGQLKGASSHEFGRALQWQIGYGVVSFGTRDLPWVAKYIHSQREHHQRGTAVERLERVDQVEGRQK